MKHMQQDPTKPLMKSAQDEAPLARLALRFTAWAERWYPDAYVFVAMVVVIVSMVKYNASTQDIRGCR